MYDKIVLGIDQSYKNTGISLGADNELLKVSSLNLLKVANNSVRRGKLVNTIDKIIRMNLDKAEEFVVLCERIRLRSDGFININYIKSIGALNACIVDTAHKYGVEVYSVDTRSWKSNVVGTSKPLKSHIDGIDPKKWPTIKWLINQGFEKSIMVEVSKQKKKGVFIRDGKRYIYDDDASDSAGICKYGFLPKSKQKLEREN